MPITNCEACGSLYEAWKDSGNYCPPCKAAGRITRYLIERGQSLHQAPTIWFKGSPDQDGRHAYEDDWTEDANKATLFGAKVDAEKAADRILGPGGAIVTEHVFVLR